MQSLDTTLTANAHPEDVLTGYAVGANGDRVFCTDCRRETREGHDVTAYAYGAAESPLWDVPGCYCERCAPATVPHPMGGAIQVLVSAVLAVGETPDGTARLCLRDVEVPPTPVRTRGNTLSRQL